MLVLVHERLIPILMCKSSATECYALSDINIDRMDISFLNLLMCVHIFPFNFHAKNNGQ